ncbi:hypothetical protein NIES4071_106270 (plasmid) [Calothrix sp. NIES-4071]|nr:hypothetical protein NIES4071_106270 [Calothrix sp. NIES-4071]BAZ65045.1 hypothetical protein NIES4105_107780 [Calothrix sp. NIES-4105]
MLKKLISTTAIFSIFAATTISFSTKPAQARIPLVYVKSNRCIGYNNAGRAVSTIRKGFYQITGGGVTNLGNRFNRILVMANGRTGTLNVSTTCLNNNGKNVISY